jgi:aspartyl-tRNA(Asn)/glutamyl-tRNA(Gln) amidotransferase subunit A
LERRAYAPFREAVEKGQTTALAEVNACLSAIENNKNLNAFLSVYAEEAKIAAKSADERFANGNARALEGLILSVKDVIAYKDHPLQASSKILNGYISPFHSTVLQRLVEAGAIVIGRVSCDEFAMGSSNQSSAFGPVKNPVNPDLVPGGSSGGSAASVAAGTCHASLGSDTGGSVRQPAAFCGLVGLKPSYSRLSRYGLIAYASSFDCIGILANTIEDTALILELCAGEDELDATSSSAPTMAYSRIPKLDQALKVAVIRDTIAHEGIQKEIVEATEATIELLKSQGHTVTLVDFPLLDYILPVYYILTTAEASSNLSRFDGVRYGYRSSANASLHDLYSKSRSEGFGPEVKRRILLGTFVLSASYYDAYYTQAQKVRRLVRDKTLEILGEHDCILTPTTPTTAFELNKSFSNPVESYLADLFTVQASVAGLPAISIPVGNDHQGLPIGLQLVTGNMEEGKLLQIAQAFMQLQQVQV